MEYQYFSIPFQDIRQSDNPFTIRFGIYITLEPMRLFALLVLAVLLPSPAFARAEGWQFVQSVGGITVGKPEHLPSGWSLPVRADVSGLTAVASKPTTLNSALICERIVAVVEGRNIFLTIVSGLAHSGSTSLCPPANLGNPAAGQYRVFYRGPSESPVELPGVSLGL
jgi:hypothetical protein